jgi:GNAT superfamily N-acetyltransferase
MWWRCSRREFEKNGNRGNRESFRGLVEQGGPTGILAYSEGEPVGWCSVAPRDSYPSLMRSRTLRPIDDRPAWSLVCFFVARQWRGRGVAKALARAAVDFVRQQGGDLLEAYPTNPRGRRLAAVSSYMGTPEMLRPAGFRECARPSEARIVMRRGIRHTRS